MEIERKFLIKDLHSLPFSIEAYPHRELEQAYLCTGPVVRIRKDDEQYFLTYKSKGLMIREEYNLPLNRQAYLHLREKADGRIIQKTRYVIPLDEVTDSSPSQKESHLSPQFREKGVSLFLELDIFKGDLAPWFLAEIEFPDEETARNYQAPDWLGEDVTHLSLYHNSTLSQLK